MTVVLIAMAPNQSIGMDSVMRSHRKIEVTESNTEKIERMAKQAVRVMDHLSRIPESPNKKPVREVEQTVELAKNKLAMLEKKGVDLNKFYSKYDVDRTGKVSYKDFSDTLVTLSSGIGKEEAHILAAKLDKTKSGSISYKNIIGALQEVERTTPQPSPNPKSNNDRRDQARSSSKHSQQNDYSDYSSFFDSMESSSLITTRESTSFFDTVKNADPKEAVSYQSLSPRVEAQDATKPPLSPELRGSRRHFYHARGDGLRSVADDLHREVPYEVDPPYGEVKKQRKRALSAPPRSARSMGKIISGDQLNSSNNEVVNNPEKRNNLRNAVDQAAKGLRPKQSHEGRITFDTIRNFASQTPVKEVQKHKKETGLIESRVVENAVVAQLGGRINTLRHMLKKHDLSNSGTVNKEEFATALKKSGVNLEKHQANELYELMTIDKSIRPVNVVENASGKALDIEEFVDRIQVWHNYDQIYCN